MLKGDLGRLLYLLGRATQHGAKARRGHRRRRADLGLAAACGTADARALLRQDAHGRSGQKKCRWRGALGLALPGPQVPHVVGQHAGHDAGRAVGRRSDDLAHARILLHHSQGVAVEPLQLVHDARHHVVLARFLRVYVHIGRAPHNAQRAWQRLSSLPLVQPAVHARLHDAPDVRQRLVYFLRRPVSLLIAAHDLSNAQALLPAGAHEAHHGHERQRQHRRVGRRPLGKKLVLGVDEAAADGVVGDFLQSFPVLVERLADHPVGVQWQLLGVQRHVTVLVKVNLLVAASRGLLVARVADR
mmetsp:Transcript_35623/g.91600  ORF Transcript_35623/g.91600 Transcript_35623/m.91600 type:complete len:301 (+) Transcript_35623:1035-1937(+)